MQEVNPETVISSENLDALFAAALELPEGVPRDRFLERLEPGQREDLSSLLTAHEQSDGFLESSPAAVRLATESKDLPSVGDRIGSYRLERILGRGGMGTVFLATQVEPVQREVAIKILTTTELAPEALAHFHIERHALCRLEHPNISHLFDAGSLADGTPYFVMDRVDGDSIDQYFDQHRISLSERVRVLAEICETLHYAHGRGVLHRDLKPSNILVAGAPDDMRVRVIDFGVAYLEGESHPDGITGGTPGYMSPEQADGENADVPADVFSLGMIGCTVLAAWAPEDGKDLINGKLEGLPCDLKLILLKATAAAVNDRYSSAAAMATDLRCYLEKRPVSARPQAAVYTGTRFVQRHPVSSILAVALLIASLILALQSWRSHQDMAVALERERSLRRESELMADYCRNLFRTPDQLSLQRGARVRDLLDAAVADAGQHFALRPVLHADILATLADSYAKLGYLSESCEIHRKIVQLRIESVGKMAPQTIEGLLKMGDVQLALGRAQETRRLAEVALIRIDQAKLDSKLTAGGKLLLARALLALGMSEKALEELRWVTEECEEPATRWIAQMELLGAAPGAAADVSERIASLLEEEPKAAGFQDQVHQTKLLLVDKLVMAGLEDSACWLLTRMVEEAKGPAMRLGAELRLVLVSSTGKEDSALNELAKQCIAELGRDHLLTLIASSMDENRPAKMRLQCIEQLITYLGPTHPLVCSLLIRHARAISRDAKGTAGVALLASFLSRNDSEIAESAPDPDIIRIRFELATQLATSGSETAAQLVLSRALSDCDKLRERERFPEVNSLLEVDTEHWTQEMNQRFLLSRVALFRSWGRSPSSVPSRRFQPVLPLAGRF